MATVCMRDFVTHAIISNFIQEQHFAFCSPSSEPPIESRAVPFPRVFLYQKINKNKQQKKNCI